MPVIGGFNPAQTIAPYGVTPEQAEIARLPNGSFVTTWQSGKQIKLRLQDAEGTPIGGIVDVTTSASSVNRPHLAVLEDGTFMLVYTSLVSATSAEVRGIKFTANLTQVGPERLLVETLETGSVFDPTITALADGGFAVAMTGLGLDLDGFSVHHRAFQSNGSPISDLQMVNQTTSSFQSFPDLVGLQNGGYVVVWRSRDVDGSFYAAMLRTYDSAGQPLSDEQRINQYSFGSQTNTRIAGLADGSLIVVWTSQYQDGSDDGVIARHFAADGTPLGNEFIVNDKREDDQNSPVVIALPDGGFAVAWTDVTDAPVTMVQQFDADIMPVADAIAVFEHPDDVDLGPDLAVTPDGQLMVSWFTLNPNSQMFRGSLHSSLSIPILSGTDVSDDWQGSEGRDIYHGLAGNDLIQGLGENDILRGGLGDDTVDGGDGIDTAQYAGAQDNFTLSLLNGQITLTDRRAGAEGSDSLQNIEFLDFEDNLLGQPLELAKFTGPTGLGEDDFKSVIELYIAYFDRAPDALGLFFWATAFANGTDLEEMSRLFMDQEETLLLYPQVHDNAAFVTDVYLNVLGREADELGHRFWVTSLNNGGTDRGSFILEMLRGAKADPPSNASPDFIAQQRADQQYLEQKTEIGIYFAVDKGMSNVANAKAAMALFDGSMPSAFDAIAAIDTYYEAAQSETGGEFLMSMVGVLDDPFWL